MNERPPVQSLRQELPFLDGAFGFQAFEEFWVDFLNARPDIAFAEAGVEVRRRVIRARPFGRPSGDRQYGLDIRAEMEGGEVWDFQCKRVETWHPGDARAAIQAYQGPATRRFLVVACNISETTRNVVGEHPGWHIWDVREATRRLRELGPLLGGPILFTHFGPGWPETFFGRAAASALMSASAWFEPWLREGRRFHLRQPYVGPRTWVDQLNAFVGQRQARVLTVWGRGGCGKSRLLWEWARQFHDEHPNATLRFVSDRAVDLEPALQVAPRPLVLILDDAHRFPEVRRELFSRVARTSEIQLVLALRPGGRSEIQRELLSAGFDSTGSEEALHVPALGPRETRELIESVLGPALRKWVEPLARAARDCPLVAALGAELVRRGELKDSALEDADDIRRRVFEGLLADADRVRETFGALVVDEFLRLLALLAPVRVDRKFTEKASALLEGVPGDHLNRLKEALEEQGLLLTTPGGTRIVPDLLSDHLAYVACYDDAGSSRGFAERVLAAFSTDEFPRLLQHLAEAEWRAFDGREGADSVVEPLWNSFRMRFEGADWLQRATFLQQWQEVAPWQPGRTVEFVALALDLAGLSETSACQFAESPGRGFQTEFVLGRLPPLLGAVAEYHPDRVGRCCDLLWRLTTLRAEIGNPEVEDHPLAVLKRIVEYRRWKAVRVHEVALDWIERLLSEGAWREGRIPLALLLDTLVAPILEQHVDDSWWTEHTLHLHETWVHLGNTSGLRARARRILGRFITEGDSRQVLQLLPILRSACAPARPRFGGDVPEGFRMEWDRERRLSLALVAEIVRRYPEPLVLFGVWRSFLAETPRTSGSTSEYDAALSELRMEIPDTPELRLVRAVFSHARQEHAGGARGADGRREAEKAWAEFLERVAGQLLAAQPRPKDWLDHLGALDRHWRSFEGFVPRFRGLLSALARTHPGPARSAINLLLECPEHPLASEVDALILPATQGDAAARFEFVEAAIHSPSEVIRAAAVSVCAGWRMEAGDGLPAAVWDLLESEAPNASPVVAFRLGTFVAWNPSQGTRRDWELLTRIPLGAEDTGVAGHLANQAADLATLPNVIPDSEAIRAFLRRLDVLTDLGEAEVRFAVPRLAERFAAELFLFLARRAESPNRCRESLASLFLEGSWGWAGIGKHPEVRAWMATCEARLDSDPPLNPNEEALLRVAIFEGCADPGAWLLDALRRVETAPRLERLVGIASVGKHENAAVLFPDFARAALVRAEEFGGACRAAVVEQLSAVGGGRGGTNCEPDADWKRLLDTLETLAHRHASDPRLGPLYQRMASRERRSMDFFRRESPVSGAAE